MEMFSRSHFEVRINREINEIRESIKLISFGEYVKWFTGLVKWKLPGVISEASIEKMNWPETGIHESVPPCAPDPLHPLCTFSKITSKHLPY